MTTERPPRRGTDVRLRQHQVGVRFSPAEYEDVIAASVCENCTPATVLRNAFLLAGQTAQRLQHLRGMLADLDGYIQRRAEDLAEPIIRDAEARARLVITEATGETQRQRDLVEELRKRIAVVDRMRDELNAARRVLAAALGEPAGALPLSYFVDRAVALIEKESERG